MGETPWFRVQDLRFAFFAATPAGFAVCVLLPLVGSASGTEKYVKDSQKGHSRSFTYFWGVQAAVSGNIGAACTNTKVKARIVSADPSPPKYR